MIDKTSFSGQYSLLSSIALESIQMLQKSHVSQGVLKKQHLASILKNSWNKDTFNE